MKCNRGIPTVDFNLYQGDTLRKQVLIKNSAGQAIDLSTASVAATLFDVDSVSPGAFTINPVDLVGGAIELFIPAALSDSLTDPVYYSDLQVTFADGDVKTFFKICIITEADYT